jgi:hypothetical protein
MAETTTRQIATIGIASATAGAILGAILGPLITGAFGYVTRISETDPKITDMAIAILQTKPRADTEQLRKWAVDAIDWRAKPALNPAQKAELLKLELPAVRSAPTR